MLIPATRDDFSAPFFDAAACGTLLLLRCGNCGSWAAPYAFFSSDPRWCPTCNGDELTWLAAEGSGTVVSWTVTHEKPDTHGNTHPTCILLVQLAEGPWMTGRATGDVAALRVGSGVIATFEPVGGGEHLPVFRIGI